MCTWKPRVRARQWCNIKGSSFTYSFIHSLISSPFLYWTSVLFFNLPLWYPQECSSRALIRVQTTGTVVVHCSQPLPRFLRCPLSHRPLPSSGSGNQVHPSWLSPGRLGALLMGNLVSGTLTIWREFLRAAEAWHHPASAPPPSSFTGVTAFPPSLGSFLIL